jgi:hypothetical protein
MALIFEPCVREGSNTTLTADFVLTGAMRRSLAFGDVMATGDTCYYVASYDNTFEEGLGTMAADGKLTRPATTERSLHADGTIDKNKVSFAAGIKTIIMTFAATQAALLPSLITGALRFDQAQSLSSGEKTQVQSNFGFFAAGTKILFQQTAAPAGWTKDTTHNDKALRIVSGTVSSGGSVAFSTLFARTAVDDHTLLTAEIPPHAHANTLNDPGHEHSMPYRGSSAFTAATPGALTSVWTGDGSTNTGSATTGITITNVNAGGGGAHGHGLDMRVQYADAIIATKD